MNSDLINFIQNVSVDELKKAINNNKFFGKDFDDFQKGKELIDNTIEINKSIINNNVRTALLLYVIYRCKGGM